MNNLVVLPGGGSPHSKAYQPIYTFHEKVASSRGFGVHTLDYVGFGHAPDIGKGLRLPEIMAKVRMDFQEIKRPARLFARSFGCTVAAWLLHHCPEVLEQIDPLVLWGPVSFATNWELLVKPKDGIEDLNQKFRDKNNGAQFSPDFWDTLEPIEVLLSHIPKSCTKNIVVGTGSEDIYCTREFTTYLADLINSRTACKASNVYLEGAPHTVMFDLDSPPSYAAAYFDMVLGSK